MLKKRKRALGSAVIIALLVGSLAGCGFQGTKTDSENPGTDIESSNVAVAEPIYDGASLLSAREVTTLDASDKYRSFYEIFVYSFWDTDGDGIGDLKGVTEKLNVLNDGDPTTDTDLGITGIWLMPIMPSTTYHKYDVTDYMAIDPEYGTMEDFEELVQACNDKGINLIIDLVMNHTSSQHPWFQTACDYLMNLPEGAEPDPTECPYIEYYHFNRGMVWGWYQVGDSEWYYEGGFWSEMPDLDLNNELVRGEFYEICKYWLDKGVAGFRLDAVKEFVSDDTEANVEILSWLNSMVKAMNPDAYLVGEAWTSQPEYAKYYASGIDSLFDFAFAGDSGYLTKFANGTYQAKDLYDYIERENGRFAEQNADYVNAPFYSNHDMNRAAGNYSGDDAVAQHKMALALNMTMTGNVFTYYGDEIGMKGSGKDENKRLAMYWDSDRNTPGMCSGPADADKKIAQDNPALNDQLGDSGSLWHWCKNLNRLRNQFVSIRKGDTVQIKELSDSDVCTLLKSYDSERVVLMYNLSGQSKEMDLSVATLADGTVLGTAFLEATLVDGTEPVTVEGDRITIPAHSIAVLWVK